ncbi:MAG: hypothetical protein R2877_08435 [Bdellovibrionota bacterium]
MIAISLLAKYATGNFQQLSQAWLDQRQKLKSQVQQWLIAAGKEFKNNKNLKQQSETFDGRTVTVKFNGRTVEVLEAFNGLPEDFSFLFGFRQTPEGLTVNGTSFGLIRNHNHQIIHSRLLGGKELMNFMFDYLENIQGWNIHLISEGWKRNENPTLSRMYEDYQQHRKSGKTDLESASLTWSGKIYSEKGFRASQVKEIQGAGSQPEIQVVFIRSVSM